MLSRGRSWRKMSPAPFATRLWLARTTVTLFGATRDVASQSMASACQSGPSTRVDYTPERKTPSPAPCVDHPGALSTGDPLLPHSSPRRPPTPHLSLLLLLYILEPAALLANALLLQALGSNASSALPLTCAALVSTRVFTPSILSGARILPPPDPGLQIEQ